MSWNYRVTKTLEPDVLGGMVEVFAMREVYYDDAGKPTSWTVEPVAAIEDSWREIADTLARMAGAANGLVLDLTDPENPTEVSPLRGVRAS